MVIVLVQYFFSEPWNNKPDVYFFGELSTSGKQLVLRDFAF